MNLNNILEKDEYSSDEIKLIDNNTIPNFSTDIYNGKIPYRVRSKNFKVSIHIGQRKLLLCCIQFLNDYGHLAQRVVYAGAAPGHNIIILSSIFPHIFDIYDPREFDSKLKDMENVNVFQDYFTNDTAKKYRKEKVLFISDIRTGSIEDDDFEEQIQINNEMQRKWHDIIKPEMGMYKFRLPYKAGKTIYMRGIIRLQAWGPLTTTETRLIVPKKYELVEYDNTEYESQMFYFNLIIRQWGIYPSYIQKIKNTNLCDCYDCRLEIQILSDWIINTHGEMSDKKLYNSINAFSEQISEHLKVGLKLPPHVPKKGKRDIRVNYIKLRTLYMTTVLKRRDDKIKHRKLNLDPNCTILK